MAKRAAAVQDPVLTPLQVKFQTMRKEMNDALIERTEEVDMVLTAMVGGYHPLLVGPPGTGKSFLAQILCEWLKGIYFDALITKFSVPEELYGPVSIIGLKQDIYRRITTDCLSEAEIAFLDEIFKGSSAILNTLLRLLNEGTFKNAGKTIVTPLIMVIAASNEWPNDQEGGKELGALFDRFILRKNVRPIATHAGRQKLLWTRNHKPTLTTTITRQEVLQARAEAESLTWTPAAMDAMERILKELPGEGIVVGDRRQYKAVGVAQAYAYMNGETEVNPESLEILGDVLWSDPVEQPEKAKKIVAKIANPMGAKLTEWMAEAQGLIETIDAKDATKFSDNVVATKKLLEIQKKVNGIKASDRQRQVADYLAAQILDIRKSTLEAQGL